MARIMFLSGHFQVAANAARVVLGDMQPKGLSRAGININDLPSAARRIWDHAARENNYCYNFALNRPAGDCAQPGDLHCARIGHPMKFDDERADLRYKDEKFDKYMEMNKRLLALDGHISLGNAFEMRAGYHPVAVFYGHHGDISDKSPGHDFHFYALRRPDGAAASGKPLVWAHKPKDQSVQFCQPGPDGLFYDASERGYHTFGGFWLVKNPQLSHK